ncbi:MAG: gamma-glutamyltransferase [Balneolaceae bacterium]
MFSSKSRFDCNRSLFYFLAALFLCCSRPVTAQVASETLRPSAKGKHGMVASANPLASLAGQKVLAKGGNAIDAIVATAAALNSVEPYMSGTAGVGYMLFYSAEEDRVRSLVFGGWVPENFDPESLAEDLAYADGAGHGTIETIGPRTAAVPGNLAGWNRALEDYGTISLAEAFDPAIDYLVNGIPVTEFDQAMWEGTTNRVQPHPEANRIYLKNGTTPYRTGDIFTNKPLARTMERIAEEGIDIFYKGEIAREIAAAFERDGGFINENDLAAVPERVQWTDPISIDYKGYTIYNNPPPGMGIQQLQTLKIMEGLDMSEMGHNSDEYLAHLLEAIHISRMDTDTHVGDPEFVSVPVSELLSDSYISGQREKVKARVRKRKGMKDSRGTSGYMDDPSDPKYRYATTSLSAVDQWGNAVVITQTLGGGFGSGYVAGNTGLAFNNAMEWMYLEPGMPNSVEPGKGVGWCVGGMMQIHKDGKPRVVVGSPGSYGILQSVPQVALNILEFDMQIQEAIDAPRFRWKDEHGSIPATEIIMETRIPEDVRRDLTDMGFVLDTRVGDWSMSVGGVQGIIIDHETGWIEGGADPRRNGYALGW